MDNRISRDTLDRINEEVISFSKRMRKSFEDDNRIIYCFCSNPSQHPKDCAEWMNKHYGTAYETSGVLAVLKPYRINTISFRKNVFSEAQALADIIIRALGGDSNAAAQVDRITVENNGRLTNMTVRGFEQIVFIALFTRSEALRALPCYPHAFKLNRNYAKDVLNSIIDIIRVNVKMTGRREKAYATSAEYEAEILKLETTLNRQALMIERLQNEFDSRVEEIRADENTALFSMLNSPKYGYILDLLLQAQQGVDSVKRQRIMLPFEINSLPILIRKLLQFTADCGIEPMLEHGRQMKITASDIENYQYEGSPFDDDIQVKTVEVVSPGWAIAEKEIVISAPRVKEVE